MGMAAAPLSLGAAGLNAYGEIRKGQTEAGNLRRAGFGDLLSGFVDSGRMKLAAAAGELQAAQTNRYLINRANDQLANIDAVMATEGGADAGSPSQYAVRNRAEALMDQQRTTEVGSMKMQADTDRLASSLYMMSGISAYNQANANAGRAAMNGWLGAAGGFMKALGGLGGGDNSGSNADLAEKLKALNFGF